MQTPEKNAKELAERQMIATITAALLAGQKVWDLGDTHFDRILHKAEEIVGRINKRANDRLQSAGKEER